MFKQSARKLLEVPRDQITKWLNSFDSVLTDCDGVLWIYSNVIDGAPDAINKLQSLGKKVFFCTNNSTKTRKELVAKAIKMGFQIEENRIVCTAHSTAAYLKNRNFSKSVYVIGMSGITQELDNVGITHNEIGPDIMRCSLSGEIDNILPTTQNVGAVVVGFDEHFSFPKMIKAASYLNDPDVLFLATNTDERFPMPNVVIPGTGSFVRAVEVSAERAPLVIGKPNPSFCEWLIKDKVIDPARTLMIGDRCNTDILLGYNCGFQTLLVGSGIHKFTDVVEFQMSDNLELKKQIPDLFLPKLGDLLQFLGA